MGEFSGTGLGPGEQMAKDDLNVKGEPGKVPTDIDGIFADGEKVGLPVFNVDKESFHQNMEYGRKRLNFPADSSVQKYLQNTRQNRPFWISYSDGNQTLVRKVK